MSQSKLSIHACIVEGGYKMTNNIKKILRQQGKSILALSEYINMTYANTHDLVNRKDLSTTPLGTLLKVAEFLHVDIKALYK